VQDIEVVVAHPERATVRVGEVFLKIDTDQAQADREVEAMRLAPVPTPEILWRQPPVLALAALPGVPIERLGEPATSSPAAWEAAGAAVRRLHDAPPPGWMSGGGPDRAATLDQECEWLVSEGLFSRGEVARGRELASVALRPRPLSFVHGDLQVAHVFVEGDAVTGILDWSEGGAGDPAYDLATLTLGHPERLDELLAGYGRDVDPDVIRAWWALRCLTAIRWLAEHEYDPFAPGCEAEVLRSLV
jgi:aminoglycoside phosphotransferase (APT) family kinase protein